MHLLKSLPLLSIITAGLAQPLLDATVPSVLSKRYNRQGELGQFDLKGCHGPFEKDPKHLLSAMVAHHKIDINPFFEKGKCTPWYPVLDQKHGPSVGVILGGGTGYVKQVQFFKSTPACAAAEAAAGSADVPDVCCHEDAGGSLGAMYHNGTEGDFGPVKTMGFEGSRCVEIGPGDNQTLWQTRYFVPLD